MIHYIRDTETEISRKLQGLNKTLLYRQNWNLQQYSRLRNV